MINLKLLQKDFDNIALKLKKKGTKAELLKELKIKSTELKTAKIDFEKLQSMQNAMSKEFGIYKREGKDISTLKAKVDKNKIHITDALNIQRLKQKELEELAMAIPNIPDDNVPFGIDENDNIELKKILIPKTFDFKPKEHWELAEQNNWIDFKRGVKIAKSRFSVIQDMGAKLERALINFMLDFNQKNGFNEISVPEIVNKTALEGTGQLPKFVDDLYKIAGEELYLIPTAEVPLTNLFQDEIIEANKLPIQITAQTACFRKEAGSAGRDVRGIIRQHQFKKVELVTISKPEESESIFEKMVACASDMLLELGLAHRQVLLCCGDLGFSAAKTIDLEVWLPGQDTYREISSISNTRDFQARRAKIRYKDKNKNNFVHTLNGSSLAVGRTMVAIMENYQNEDGSITIPNALKAYIS